MKTKLIIAELTIITLVLYKYHYGLLTREYLLFYTTIFFVCMILWFKFLKNN